MRQIKKSPACMKKKRYAAGAAYINMPAFFICKILSEWRHQGSDAIRHQNSDAISVVLSV